MTDKNLLWAFRLAVTAILLTACGKNSGEKTGTVSFSLDVRGGVTDVATKSSVGDFTALPKTSAFTLNIEADGTEVLSIDNPEGPVELLSGNYSVKAVYGSPTKEGFGRPCFSGEQTFSITGGQTSSVNIPVRLANCVVRLEFTDNFRNYYRDWRIILTTGQGNTFAFTPGESRALFMDAYLVKVAGTLTNQAGKTFTIPSGEYRNLDPATCYTMRFDASNIGGNSLSISFNNDLQDVDLGETELND